MILINSFGNSQGNSNKICLLLIIFLRFTCGEKKILPNIKKSKNIITVVVVWLFYWKLRIKYRRKKRSYYNENWKIVPSCLSSRARKLLSNKNESPNAGINFSKCVPRNFVNSFLNGSFLRSPERVSSSKFKQNRISKEIKELNNMNTEKKFD